MSADLSEVRLQLAALPNELVGELLSEFEALRQRFLLRDWGPGELNGGRFGEATLRILEWMMDGQYTPIGKQLNRNSIIKRVENDSSLPEGQRFHVRRSVELLLDIRNKRDVGHLGAGIDVNRMDSELVLRLCSWVLAEMVREFGQADPETAQSLIDKISAERVPWIEEVDGDLLVLATELPAAQRALLALHRAHPSAVPISELRSMVRYSHSTQFKTKVLEALTKDLRIHIKNGAATITSKGIKEIEAVLIALRDAT